VSQIGARDPADTMIRIQMCDCRRAERGTGGHRNSCRTDGRRGLAPFPVAAGAGAAFATTAIGIA
jgi:hypothetical protein